MRETRSTCPYCGVGCGVIIESRGAQITGVRGDPDHPANQGRLCTKGSTLHLTASAAITQQNRLLQPLRRLERGGSVQPVSWNEAMDFAAGQLLRIVDAHGPDALGFYISGQMLTEDYYVFNKLTKGLLGTNNVDSNSRLCMSSAVAGYKRTLGMDSPPTCYEDLDTADCLFIVGSNTAWAHPILFRRIEAAKAARPGMRIVVADPRRTDTADQADLYLPLLPGTDVMLFHGMLYIMLWEGWTDSAYITAHTSGFEDLKDLVRQATPEKVAQVCGISTADLMQAARWFATSKTTLSLYCQGLNQSSSGTAKNAALINLHLATGQIGKPGAGPFSLTGQPNAMGGREVGGMANLLSAHRDLANPTHRAEVAALWGVSDVPAKPGKTAVEMFEATADGEIKALWIACTNPAQSMPDQTTVRAALARAELVVVQEAFATTATCAYADLLLPASTWGEKAGTVTNSERRISRVRAAVPAPGQARHDWAIGVDLAQRLEKQLRPGLPTLFPYTQGTLDQNTESIWNEHRESTRGRDLDITGLSYGLLEREGPQQWPCPQGVGSGQARLYTDGVFPTANGRAQFAVDAYKPLIEPRNARFPFSLNTGRLRDQWHGMSRTGTLGRLFGHVAEPSVGLNPQDMARLGLKELQLVALISKRGQVLLQAKADPQVAPTQAFLAMHWGSEVLGGIDSAGLPLCGVNALMPPAFCPTSKQPELKHAAVRIEPVELPWTLVAQAWLPAGEVETVRATLRECMTQFDFASCVPFSNGVTIHDAGSERHGVLFRAAANSAPDPAVLQKITSLLRLDGADSLRYADAHLGQLRAVRQARDDKGDSVIMALLLAGNANSEAWLSAYLRQGLPAQTLGRHLLSGSSTAPVKLAPLSPQICACFNVTQASIQSVLRQHDGPPADQLMAVQTATRCGTNCGSCLPSLNRLIATSTRRLVTTDS
jgi:assimilatory nitrate reductase catalytic subunit